MDERIVVELTNREYAIMRGLASGLTQEQLAVRLGRSLATVARAMGELKRKLGAATVPQIVDRAWRLGLLQRETPLLPHEQPIAPGRVVYPAAVIRERRRVLDEALHGHPGRR